MHIIVLGGTALSLLGLVGILWSVIAVVRARRSATSDEDLRAKIQRALPINLLALLLSVIGLMTVGLGLFLF